MTDSSNASSPFEPEINRLKLQLDIFRRQLLDLRQEKADLEVMLEDSSYHADVVLAEVYQEKQDLELILETSVVHSEAVERDLYQQAAVAKRKVSEQFQLIAESSPVGLLIVCINTSKVLYANAKTCEMLGRSVEQLLTQKTTDFYVNPTDREWMIGALLNQQTFQGELQCLRFPDQTFWAMVSLCPFVFQDEPTLLMAMQDITAQKQAEAALALAEKRYRSIFENALEGIFQTDATGEYIRVNPAMARMCGYGSSAEMVHQEPSLWAKRFVHPQVKLAYKQLLSQQGELKNFEYQCYRRNGQIVWLEENTRAVQDSLGQILYYEGIVQEINERKQTEAALRQQVQQLQVEVDQAKRDREVRKIAQTNYFQNLIAEADSLRFSDDDGNDDY